MYEKIQASKVLEILLQIYLLTVQGPHTQNAEHFIRFFYTLNSPQGTLSVGDLQYVAT